MWATVKHLNYVCFLSILAAVGAFGEAHALWRLQTREFGRCETQALLQMFGCFLLRSGKIRKVSNLPALCQHHHS